MYSNRAFVKDFLGANAKARLIVNIGPCEEHEHETFRWEKRRHSRFKQQEKEKISNRLETVHGPIAFCFSATYLDLSSACLTVFFMSPLFLLLLSSFSSMMYFFSCSDHHCIALWISDRGQCSWRSEQEWTLKLTTKHFPLPCRQSSTIGWESESVESVMSYCTDVLMPFLFLRAFQDYRIANFEEEIELLKDELERERVWTRFLLLTIFASEGSPPFFSPFRRKTDSSFCRIKLLWITLR